MRLLCALCRISARRVGVESSGRAPYRVWWVRLAVDERAGPRATRYEDALALVHLETRSAAMLADGKCGAGAHVMAAWGSGRAEDLRPVQMVTGDVETGVLGNLRSVKVYATQGGSYEPADGAGRYKLWNTGACARSRG